MAKCDMGEKEKKDVRGFWTANPCTKNIIDDEEGTEEFFLRHDRIVDNLAPYNYEVFNYEECAGKKVLEVGCGMGSHAARFARHAGNFVTIDLTSRGTSLTRKRLDMYGLNGSVVQADAENLPFKDGSFDRVYSNGVIHHTPDTQKAADEIHRVLRKDGEAKIMVYYKNSVFYYYDLMLKLRMKYLVLKMMPVALVKAIFEKRMPKVVWLKNEVDRLDWKGLKQFCINVSDGHGNPHTKVYTKAQAAQLFGKFSSVRFDLRGTHSRLEDRVRFIEKRFGWALFAYLRK